MKQITVTVYSFDELPEIAQEKAISDHINFIIDVELSGEHSEDSIYWPNVLKAEAMQTPWFLGSYIYENNKADIIEDIKANEYTFLLNGTMKNS